MSRAGIGGPPPKRDAERRRRNKDAIPTTTIDIDSLIAAPVEVPTGEDDWHPIARMTFESFQKSGQAIFYEPSDWATIFLLCEAIDRELQPQPIVKTDADGNQEIEMHELPIKGATLNAMLKGFASLLATEGDRRRVRIELERKAAADAIAGGDNKVVSISKSREARLA